MRKFLFLLTALVASTGLASQTNVTIKVPGATLSGTLQTPEQPHGRVPVVLILPGSGPTDRDGNSAAGPAGTYRKLAAQLAAQGIASLRIDKRGIGRSLVVDRREEALSFEDSVNDTRAWLNWLSGQAQLGQIGLIGHSEGGLVALAVLQQETPVQALVLLATPGESVGATIRRQLQQNPANPPGLTQEADRILRSLEQGKQVSTVSPVLMPLFRPSVQPYLISVLRYDPIKLIAAVDVPALIVQGDRDLQVRPEDAKQLSVAQAAAHLRLIPGMNHVLVEAPMDVPGNLKTYADANATLAQTAVTAIVTFLKEYLLDH